MFVNDGGYQRISFHLKDKDDLMWVEKGWNDLRELVYMVGGVGRLRLSV